jgi:hypothetical protein
LSLRLVSLPPFENHRAKYTYRALHSFAAFFMFDWRFLYVDLKGHGVNVTGFDTQRDLTACQDVYTCCSCTHSKDIGRYHSREAPKP